MDEKNFLAEKFEANRAHLRAVAYRMLGSTSEVDDAVQETWLRLSRTDTSAVENLGGCLTTVVARVCLDMLRSRKSRREEPIGPQVPEPIASDEHEHEADMADSVGAALLVVLETLAEIRGAAAVAETFKGRAQAAKPALVDGAMALAVIFGGQLRIVLRLTIDGERISAVDAVADAEAIGAFEIEVL